MKLLDLFCCEGGAGMGYSLAGFDVTGVDIVQRHRYPFQFIPGDALEYLKEHGHEFDVIHTSPPCQSYSRALKHLAAPKPALIPELRQALIRTGKPYIIENVVGAPLHGVVLCGTMFGRRFYRHRIFETNFPVLAINSCDHSKSAMNPHNQMGRDRIYCEFGRQDPEKIWRKEMGVEWMTKRGGRECVPPCFTEWIGRSFMATGNALGVE